MAQSLGRRRRLSTDRCLRLWSIVEHVAEHPGMGRAAMAERFSLSERQLQADLNVIRDQIGLPLVRTHGYRFADAPNPEHALTLADLVALAGVIQPALADPTIPREPVLALAARLPALFSPSLQELARATLCVSPERAHSPDPFAFLLLAEAWLRGQPVRLQYLAGTAPAFSTEPVVVPQVLMPYEGSWYVIGSCPEVRGVASFCLDAVETIGPEAPGP